MRISKFIVEEKFTKNSGIKNIDLSNVKLGEIVALIGKNGAGKSRILEFVKNYTSYINKSELITEYFDHLPNKFDRKSIQTINQIKETQKMLNDSSLHPNKRQSYDKQLKSLKNEENSIISNFRSIYNNYVKIIDNDQLKVIESEKDKKYSFSSLIENSVDYSKEKSISEFYLLNSNSSHEYINTLARNYLIEDWNRYHHLNNDNTVPMTNFTKRFEALKKYIKIFLNKELDIKAQKIKDPPLLNPFIFLDQVPFEFMKLSPGEKTLFAYAILFFLLEQNTTINIAESILILDEPEKHLHPESQINLINSLKNIVKGSGQLWIATHSLVILSCLDPSEIFLVKNNTLLNPNTKTPVSAFNELVGIGENISKITLFFEMIPVWDYYQFLIECLLKPNVIAKIKENDQQFELFKKVVSNGNNLSILDYGAGKGRIGDAINSDENIRKKIDFYCAIEPNLSNHDELKKVPILKRIYKSIEDVEENFFNLIIMCNVLHEIEPNKWINIFVGFRKILKEKGFLLILEDKYPVRGEKPNKIGQIIFDLKQFKILFNTESILYFQSENQKYRDRLLCIAIEKKDILVDENTIKKSIESFSEKMFTEIKKYKEGNLQENGRIYALYSQLYINSIFALKNLKNN